MTKREFVDITLDHIKQERRRNFPDLRPSEEAAATVNDHRKVASLWRHNRPTFANMLPGVYADRLKAKPKE